MTVKAPMDLSEAKDRFNRLVGGDAVEDPRKQQHQAQAAAAAQVPQDEAVQLQQRQHKQQLQQQPPQLPGQQLRLTPEQQAHLTPQEQENLQQQAALVRLLAAQATMPQLGHPKVQAQANAAAAQTSSQAQQPAADPWVDPDDL